MVRRKGEVEKKRKDGENGERRVEEDGDGDLGSLGKPWLA